MPSVWLCHTDTTPTEVGTSPIPPLRVCGSDELAVLHRRGTDRSRPAIIGNPGVGRHSGTSECDPRAATEQFCGRRNRGWGCHAHPRTVPGTINTRRRAEEEASRHASSSASDDEVGGVKAYVSSRFRFLTQVIMPVLWSRRAASAIEPVIDG